MHEDEKRKDLTSALKALEMNNAIPPEERQKRDEYTAQEAVEASQSIISPLRTFESDAADAIKQGQQSLYSITKAEQAKKKIKKESDPEKEELKKNSFLLLLSGALFLAGGAFLLYFFVLKSYFPTQNQDIGKKDNIDSIIPSQYETTIDAGTGSVAASIKAAVANDNIGQDDIENIRIIKDGANVDITTILLELSSNIPPALLRSFSANKYMIGTLKKDAEHPFFIMKVDYFENAFAGMLSWEPQMSDLFTKLDKTSAEQPTWSDVSIRNKDVRVAKGASGDIRLLYGFYDKETLIITENEDVYSTIVNLLNTSKLVR